MEPINPHNLTSRTNDGNKANTAVVVSLDARSPNEALLSSDLQASSMGTSREEEEDSSNQNSSDCKSPGQR